MLTLGQASCLVLGYLPNVSEERKKAKQHLQKSGLIAAYLRGQDPFRPMAIGMNVIERDPYTYISYPESPRILTEDIFHSEPHNNVYDDNDDHVNNNDSGNKDSSDDENDNSNIGEASYLTKAGHKRNHSGEIVPFCKNRLLHMISTIASHEDPHNDDCYVQQFATTESQFAMIRAIFPRLEYYCSIKQLQYWISQAGLWGTISRRKINGVRVSGRNLWIVKEQYRAFLADNCDSISAYWSHLQNCSDFMTIGYVRKSPTNETRASRARLLQLMIDKLYFRGKCEEVFVSPCCLANQPILERDYPRANEILALLKGCQGDITDLTSKIHYTQKGIRLVIIDFAGLSTCPEDIQNFLKTYNTIQEIVIDHGSSFETLSRYQLLKSDSINKFKCREKCVQRSQTPK